MRPGTLGLRHVAVLKPEEAEGQLDEAQLAARVNQAKPIAR
jgi:hypothetical protein